MERRKSNKQITIEQVKKELDAVVNFDGGLVYKCDLEELKDMIKSQGKMLDKIYPKVTKDIEKARAYQIIGEEWETKVSSSQFWIKMVFGVVLFMVSVYTVINWFKGFIK